MSHLFSGCCSRPALPGPLCPRLHIQRPQSSMQDCLNQVLPEPSQMIDVQVLLRLQAVLDGMQQADEDDELVFITRLVQLACSARAQLREKSFGLPAASSTLLKKLYPTLMVASLADAASYEGALQGPGFKILRGFECMNEWGKRERQQGKCHQLIVSC